MDKNQIREVIARRAALELHDGDVVNLAVHNDRPITHFAVAKVCDHYHAANFRSDHNTTFLLIDHCAQAYIA